MKFIFTLTFSFFAIFQINAQQFSGIPLSKILPFDFNFTQTKSVVLVNNTDTLATWLFDKANETYTKTTANRTEIIKYYSDSTLFLKIDLHQDGNRFQQKLVSNNNGQLLRTETLQTKGLEYAYHSTNFREDFTIHMYIDPATKKWKREIYENGEWIKTTKSSDKNESYKSYERSLESFFYKVNNSNSKSQKERFYNPSNFCVYQDKQCILAQNLNKPRLESALKEKNIAINSYYFLVEKSKVSTVYSIQNDYIFQPYIGEFCKQNNTTKVFVTDTKDELRVMDSPQIELLQIDLSKKD